MKSIDYTTGFQIEVTTNVIYRGLRKELFQTTKNTKANEVWIENGTAFTAYCVSFDMTPSNSELLSESKYLDSYIGEDSGMRKVIQELMKWTPESTRRLLSTTEDEVMEHFEKQCNLFNAHSYINFVTGFELTNKLYARFVQDKELNIRNFEKQVGSYHNGYSVPEDLLNTEKRCRLHLLHTISTVHMMEQFVQKVELVSETERENAKLCPLAGEGLTKRMLTNVKVDSFTWMKAKLEVRKHYQIYRTVTSERC